MDTRDAFAERIFKAAVARRVHKLRPGCGDAVGWRERGSVGVPVFGGCLCLCRWSISLPVGCSRSFCWSRSDGLTELELLRHELSILRRQARRPRLTESDGLLLAALSRLILRALTAPDQRDQLE